MAGLTAETGAHLDATVPELNKETLETFFLSDEYIKSYKRTFHYLELSESFYERLIAGVLEDIEHIFKEDDPKTMCSLSVHLAALGKDQFAKSLLLMACANDSPVAHLMMARHCLTGTCGFEKEPLQKRLTLAIRYATEALGIENHRTAKEIWIRALPSPKEIIDEATKIQRQRHKGTLFDGSGSRKPKSKPPMDQLSAILEEDLTQTPPA